MADTVQLRLPSGAVIRICAECGVEPPRHQYFCIAVRGFKRSDILREMVDVEDELRLQPEGSRAAFVLHMTFRSWAWWLGLELVGTPKVAREDMRAEVEETRQRLARKRARDVAVRHEPGGAAA